MKKVILIAAILFTFVFVESTQAIYAAPKLSTFKGQVISLDDVIKNTKDKQLTKSQAKELVEACSPLVFFLNKKVYFVTNEDGSFAFNKLKNYAHNKRVAIKGTKKSRNGINYIIMSSIESLD